MKNKLTNGWPDVTINDIDYEVKRGADRMRSDQRLRHDLLLRRDKNQVRIAHFPRKSKSDYIIFKDYQAFDAWLRCGSRAGILETGIDSQGRFPKCRSGRSPLRPILRRLLETPEAAACAEEISKVANGGQFNLDRSALRAGAFGSETNRYKKHGPFHTMLNDPPKATQKQIAEIRAIIKRRRLAAPPR